MSILYYDLWAEYSDMEAYRSNKPRAYDINPVYTYPRQHFIPELKRNGLSSEYHDILSYSLFVTIFSDGRTETLLKAGQHPMLRRYIRNSFNMERSWASVKICIRNGYTVTDGSMWCDTVDLLRHFGKDTNNPKHVCPFDLETEHDRFMHKRNKKIERKKLEGRVRQARKHEKAYRKFKDVFFGIASTDGTLQVRVLESVTELAAEGMGPHHYAFSNSYFLEENSPILSVIIDGKRIETVEAPLETLEVVQSRGLHDSNTEYYDRIVDLVDSNVSLICQRVGVAQHKPIIPNSMEIRVEGMVYLWDDKIPTILLEFVNPLTLATSEEQLRRSIKDFAEKHGLDRLFLCGFGSHHFYLYQRYTNNPEVVMKNKVLSIYS